jgi:prepilin-type processing-associated H-X9-DG protein
VAFTDYLGVAGRNQSDHDGILFDASNIRLADILDGTSNTLMVGERPPSSDLFFGWWYAGVGQNQDGSADMLLGSNEKAIAPEFNECPRRTSSYGPGRLNNICDALHFWSLHPGGANFLMADGSVHFLAYSAKTVLPALATRAGGEAVTLP